MGATPDLGQAAVYALVRGRVQGVGFRYFAAATATRLGLTGYVRNRRRPDQVEILAEGVRDRLEELVAALRGGPPGARIEAVDLSWSEPSGRYSDFRIDMA